MSFKLNLKDLEVGIFKYDDLVKCEKPLRYVLLKHYNELEFAKKDLFKLIGKMCKKDIRDKEKYFFFRKR